MHIHVGIDTVLLGHISISTFFISFSLNYQIMKIKLQKVSKMNSLHQNHEPTPPPPPPKKKRSLNC